MDSPLDAIYAEAAEGSGKKRGRKGKKQDVAEPATPEEIASLVQTLEKSMRDHARNLEFEEAAVLRDRIRALRERMIALS